MTEKANTFPYQEQTCSFREMAKLLAERVRPAGESSRATVDKVRKRMDYALDHGELKWAVPSQQLLSTREVLLWARKKWPDKFEGIPVRQDVDVGDVIGVRDRASSLLLPGDIDECHQALLEANRTIFKLRLEVLQAQAEVARLRPSAERYEEIRRNNQESAKRPRGA